MNNEVNFNIQHSTIKIQHFIRLIRPVNLLMILFTQYMVRFGLLYPLYKAFGCSLQLNEGVFALFSLAFLLMAAGGYIINDYYDIEIDEINKPDKVVIGTLIKPESAYKAYWIISGTGVLTGSLAAWLAGSTWLSSIFFFYLISLWLYSTSFKSMFLIGNIVVAVSLALVPLAAGSIEFFADLKNLQWIDQWDADPTEIMYLITIISAFAFISTLAREIVKDLEDIEGDKAKGCKTLAIVMGKKAACRITQGLLLIMICFLAFLQYKLLLKTHYTGIMISVFYFICFIQLPALWVIIKINNAAEAAHFHKLSNYLKLLMVSGISYLFVFAYLCLH